LKIHHIICAAFASTALSSPVDAREPQHPANGPGEEVNLLFSRAVPNIPGKSLIALEVHYPPGGTSQAHRHAKSAFIYGYVVSGRVRTQVAGEPVHVYSAGESFHEDPGSHHLAGGNASTTEPAKLLAVFVVDTDDKQLTTPDQ